MLPKIISKEMRKEQNGEPVKRCRIFTILLNAVPILLWIIKIENYEHNKKHTGLSDSHALFNC